jgi:hypothetical protein
LLGIGVSIVTMFCAILTFKRPRLKVVWVRLGSMADPPRLLPVDLCSQRRLHMISEKTSGDRSTKCFLDEPLQE